MRTFTKWWLDGSEGCSESFCTAKRGKALRVKARLGSLPQYLDLLYPRFACPQMDPLSVKKKQKRSSTAFHVIQTAKGGYVLRNGTCKVGIYLVNCATKAKNQAANVRYYVDKNQVLCLQVIAKHGLRHKQELLVWYDERNKNMFCA